MALKKTAGATAGTAKKTTAKGSTAKKAAPKKAAGATATKKKAAPKKAAGPKLSEPQHKLLEKLAGISDPAGYHADKKPENKSLETLLKHKLVKRGKKHPTDQALPLHDLQGGPEAPGVEPGPEPLDPSRLPRAVDRARRHHPWLLTRPAASPREVDRPSFFGWSVAGGGWWEGCVRSLHPPPSEPKVSAPPVTLYRT